MDPNGLSAHRKQDVNKSHDNSREPPKTFRERGTTPASPNNHSRPEFYARRRGRVYSVGAGVTGARFRATNASTLSWHLNLAAFGNYTNNILVAWLVALPMMTPSKPVTAQIELSEAGLCTNDVQLEFLNCCGRA